MVHSMTAFARADSEVEGLHLGWELRSVNHRFLEVQFRLPESMRSAEHQWREVIRRHLHRGKLDCTLRIAGSGAASALQLNRPLLLQILATLEQVRRDAPEVGPPSAVELLRWPGMLAAEPDIDPAALDEPVSDLFESALTDLIAHRQREGAALRETIIGRLDVIDTLVEDIKHQAATMTGQIQQRLRQRLDELAASVDADRLEQEVALLAGRGDISEELDRLRIHVEEARTNLHGAGPHGRRLDFLTQELNREANTVGAKSMLAEVSQRAVELKVVIEQIREQVQNLE